MTITRLQVRAYAGLLSLFLVTAAVVFIPYGGFDDPPAWGFLAAYFLPPLVIVTDLLRRDPTLLERRMRGGPRAEREVVQKAVMALGLVGFVGLLTVPSLDHRFGWSHVSMPLVGVGDALIVIGWGVIFRVFRENPFAAATVDVFPGHRLADQGLYAVVRHPMYSGALLILIGSPLALDSVWGGVALVTMLPALIWRLLAEETFLAVHLPGYRAYQRKVQKRLIPFLW